jgi:hypothetical protein
LPFFDNHVSFIDIETGEHPMKRTQALLPITHWLVDAAAFVCMLVCGLLAAVLIGIGFVALNAERLPIPASFEGVARGDALAAAATGVILSPLAEKIEAAGADINIDGVGPDISPISILTILLVFVLAQIFRRGAEMRSDLEGTV